MHMIMKTLMLSATTALLLNASAGSREVSYAVEDAAARTVAALSADPRVREVKSIAFVKLNLPDAKGGIALGSNLSQVFESTLTARPESFVFVTHATHAEEWKLIDGVFDQAADFETYDPKTHPELNKLKLADALLIGQVIDAKEDVRDNETETSLRVAMRLIKITTGEQLWGQAIDGRHLVRVDRVKDLEEKAVSLLTFKNIIFALGALVGLVILLIVLRQMIRVR